MLIVDYHPTGEEYPCARVDKIGQLYVLTAANRDEVWFGVDTFDTADAAIARLFEG